MLQDLGEVEAPGVLSISKSTEGEEWYYSREDFRNQANSQDDRDRRRLKISRSGTYLTLFRTVES